MHRHIYGKVGADNNKIVKELPIDKFQCDSTVVVVVAFFVLVRSFLFFFALFFIYSSNDCLENVNVNMDEVFPRVFFFFLHSSTRDVNAYKFLIQIMRMFQCTKHFQ